MSVTSGDHFGDSACRKWPVNCPVRLILNTDILGPCWRHLQDLHTTPPLESCNLSARAEILQSYWAGRSLQVLMLWFLRGIAASLFTKS